MPLDRDLPPLSALRVFEAAARHLSFTRAAAELGMTQAAVSYQVRLLEDRIGSPLFLRGKRPLALTEAGVALSGPATESLDLLASGYAAARGSVAGMLTLDVVPSFALCWLARHIGGFQGRHPDLAVRVVSSPTLGEFAREEADCDIRWGFGPWQGLSCHPLFDAAFTPMLSPDALARVGGGMAPADLLRIPRLDPTDPWWDTWFQGAGVAPSAAPKPVATGLRAQHLGAAAAMAGRGVALLTPFLWREQVAAGRLVQPFDLVCRDGSAFWLCYPASRRHLAKLRLFRDWLLAHFPSDGRTTSAR